MKAFAVHPGVVDTALSRGSGLEFPKPDPTELAACTMLYLTSGKADWLSGRCVAVSRARSVYPNVLRRYLSANWELEEVEREWKEKILEQNGLVNKLCIPK